MDIRRQALRVIVAAENAYERWKARRSGPPLLEAYRGYCTPDRLVLRGRVLTHLRRGKPAPEQSRWTNFRQMVSLFLTTEVAGVTVEVEDRGVTGQSDDEGYLALEVPRDGRLEPGWARLSVRIRREGETGVPFPVLVPHPEARFGIISDVDDTMIETGAFSLARNLWTTFTGSTLTRHVYPDSVRLIETLNDEHRNPVFYVSSSPWNLHHFLDVLFARAGLEPGPMFLRDLGVGERKLLAGSHGSHKGAAIDKILPANPGIPFVLIGDTGQHDAEVYLDAIRRHPGRIAAVVLREPGPGPKPDARAAMSEIEAGGTPLLSGPDFEGFAERLAPHLPPAGAGA